LLFEMCGCVTQMGSSRGLVSCFLSASWKVEVVEDVNAFLLVHINQIPRMTRCTIPRTLNTTPRGG